jgi:hypothetical protein
VLNDIIPPSQFYAASNDHIPPENDSVTHTNMEEDVFIATNTTMTHLENLSVSRRVDVTQSVIQILMYRKLLEDLQLYLQEHL